MLMTIAIIVPCLAFGASITTPNTFEAGTVISASDVNQNFTTLTTGINAVDTRVTTLEAKALPSASAVMAYAGTSVADGPLTRTFNSSGGTNVLAGANGSYTVTLGGIDCNATAPGSGIAVSGGRRFRHQLSRQRRLEQRRGRLPDLHRMLQHGRGPRRDAVQPDLHALSEEAS
ncbi:MAG: hypothetical protein H0V17_22470 [Deltaproteobacteria bacterium]|nr:hypothetical protein [Deltaproteobacteria bacterium]